MVGKGLTADAEIEGHGVLILMPMIKLRTIETILNVLPNAIVGVVSVSGLQMSKLHAESLLKTTKSTQRQEIEAAICRLNNRPI